jgi:hypothetical protein
VQTNYTSSLNGNFITLTDTGGNATHYGQVNLEVLNDITVLLFNVIVTSETRTIFDQSIDWCKMFADQRGGFIANILRRYSLLLDEKLLKCPIKKGKYVYLAAREVDFLNDPKLKEKFPSFIPAQGKYTMIITGKTVWRKKMVLLSKTFQTYEFCKNGNCSETSCKSFCVG